jgi:predicted PurR-regulated permease PerM
VSARESEPPTRPGPSRPPGSAAAGEAEPSTPVERELAGETKPPTRPGPSRPPGSAAAGEAEPPTPAERELADEPPAPGQPEPREPERVLVPRWVQLVVLPLALLALWALARAAGKVLVIFIVAAVIALILNPLVAFVQRRVRLPRGLAVLAVYLAFFLTLAGVGFLLANPISHQVETFTHNLPHIVDEANVQIAKFQRTLDNAGIHVKFTEQGKTALQTLQAKLSKSASRIASSAGGVLTEVAGALVDVVLVFVLSVYMLVYGQSIGRLVRRAMPPGDGTPADDYPLLAQHALSRYVGGQLLFSLIMGASAGLALYIFGVLGIFPDGRSYALAFGVFYGVMELVPYIGPILGAIPPVLLALFTDPISALWLVLLFIALQQLEGHIVAPQIFGHTLRINPLLVIFSLLIGLQLYGIVGALVALPILSVLRETAVYLHRHLQLEPWERSPGRML